jgi:renalase
MSADIVIIGAGMTGLSCARRLADAGHAPVILDKGRGIGGRMATRRVTLNGEELRFDHGAQYFTAKDPAFAAMLVRVPQAVAVWADDAAHPHHVGLPGMSGLPRAMTVGLDLRQGVEVTALRRTDHGWTLTTGDASLTARQVVLAVPAPQALRLLGATHPLAVDLASVEMAPCLTLMAAFARDAPRPFVNRASESHPLAWIAQDSTKPGRSGTSTTWVAQASADWSGKHLEDEREIIAARMLPLLCEVIGAAPDRAIHVAAHRWRHARVTRALGQPFLRSDGASLHIGGDWCLGPRIECAWQSGDAIARDILEGRDQG